MEEVQCPYCKSTVDAEFQDKVCPFCGQYVKSEKWLDSQAKSFIRHSHKIGRYESIENYVWNGEKEKAICEIRAIMERTDIAVEPVIISIIEQKKEAIQKQKDSIRKAESQHNKRCKKCSAIFPGSMERCPSCGTIFESSAEKSPYVISVPKKPQLFTKGNAQALLFGIVMIAVPFIMSWLSLFYLSPVIFVGMAVVGVIFVFGVPFLYYLEMRDYTQATRDYEGFVKRRTEEINRNIKKEEESQRRTAELQEEKNRIEAERLDKLPMCPICGKKDKVNRISTMNRSVSVATFGLASSKIGKQYQCTRCKHLW